MKFNTKYSILSISILVLVTGFFNSTAEVPPLLWTKNYTPSFMSMKMSAEGQAVHELADGSFIAGGWGTSPHIVGFAVKTNKDGDSIWTAKFFENPATHGSYNCTSLEPVPGGGFIMAGSGMDPSTMKYGLRLVKMNDDGSKAWDMFYKVEGDSIYTSGKVVPTPDGGFIAVGWLTSGNLSNDNMVALVVKTDSQGNLEWMKKYGPEDKTSICYSIKVVPAGGYIISGTREDPNPHGSTMLIKIDDNGVQEWMKLYGDESPNEENRVLIDPDGGYIVAGTDGAHFVLMKVTADGTASGYYKYGLDEKAEHAYAADVTSDGGYILAGYQQTEVQSSNINKLWIVKTSKNGDEEWALKMGGDLESIAYSIKQTMEGGYIITGSEVDENDMSSLYLVRLGAGSVSVNDKPIENSFVRLHANYPNPVSEATYIRYDILKAANVTINVYDANGSMVRQLVNEYHGPDSYLHRFESQNLASGIYYYTIECGGEKTSRNIVIEK